MRTLYKADTSLKRTLLLGTNGVRFIEIPLYNNKITRLKKKHTVISRRLAHPRISPPLSLTFFRPRIGPLADRPTHVLAICMPPPGTYTLWRSSTFSIHEVTFKIFHWITTANASRICPITFNSPPRSPSFVFSLQGALFCLFSFVFTYTVCRLCLFSGSLIAFQFSPYSVFIVMPMMAFDKGFNLCNTHHRQFFRILLFESEINIRSFKRISLVIK